MTKTVEQWLNEWLEVYVKKNLAENTYRCYDESIKRIIQEKPEFILKPVEEVSELEIQKLFNSFGFKHSKSMLNDIRIVREEYNTQEELAAALQQALKAIEASTKILAPSFLSRASFPDIMVSNLHNPRCITVREYLDKNLLSFYPKASDRTKQCYVTAAKKLVKLIGHLSLDELTRSNLQNTLDSLSNYSSSTIDKARLVMKKMVEMAVDEELISKNVAMKVVSPRSKQMDNRSENEKIYLQTQLAEILSYAKDEPDPQLFTVLTLLAFTGMRPGELRGLEKRDVLFASNQLTIRQAATTEPKLDPNQALAAQGPRKPVIGLTKSRSGVRTLYLGKEIIAVIQKWLDYLKATSSIQFESTLLFPNSEGMILRDDVLNMKFRRFKKRHGLDDKFKLYRFRHTFCTNLFHEKVDIKTVQKLMGDSTVDIILKVYTHVLDDDTKQAGEEINKAYVKMLPNLFETDHADNTTDPDESHKE
jgi:site-specific recombinase XerD